MAEGMYYGQGTPITDASAEFKKDREKEKKKADKERESRERIKCIQNGGEWIIGPDGVGRCSLPLTKEKDPFNIELEPELDFSVKYPYPIDKPQEPTKLTTEQRKESEKQGANIITDAEGNERIQTKEDVEREKALIETPGLSAAQALEINKIKSEQQEKNQSLISDIGSFSQMPLSNENLFDYEQGIKQGLLKFVPQALTSLGALSILRGGMGAVKAGRGLSALGTNPRALAGGVGSIGSSIGGLLGGINPYVVGASVLAGLAGSMIGEFSSQRRDTINAQKRVLDEGKQTMKDWATMIKTDPANKTKYLKEYNKVAQQINQAYRQMNYDVKRDFTKFERAIPDLAEFEAFYAPGGERDELNEEIKLSLLTPSTVDYEMLELANRRLGYN